MWIGVHDHPDTAVRWLDAAVSYTWLRAFEGMQSVETVAYLREPHYSENMSVAIRGVKYCFRKTDFPTWVDEIILNKPNLILYNLCGYTAAARGLWRLKEELPKTVHVMRVHHEVDYLAATKGFKECMMACDVIIAPTPFQAERVRHLLNDQEKVVYSLPFGIRSVPMHERAKEFSERTIDLACACNRHPGRNVEIVEKVIAELNRRGYVAKNFQGLPSKQLAEQLGQSKVFWLSSMTEASGSRILPEAISAGCFPVVFRECSTAVDLVRLHSRGSIVLSGINYDYKRKIAKVPEGIVDKMVLEIENAIEKSSKRTAGEGKGLPCEYEESVEIQNLIALLQSAREVTPTKATFNFIEKTKRRFFIC